LKGDSLLNCSNSKFFTPKMESNQTQRTRLSFNDKIENRESEHAQDLKDEIEEKFHNLSKENEKVLQTMSKTMNDLKELVKSSISSSNKSSSENESSIFSFVTPHTAPRASSTLANKKEDEKSTTKHDEIQTSKSNNDKYLRADSSSNSANSRELIISHTPKYIIPNFYGDRQEYRQFIQMVKAAFEKCDEKQKLLGLLSHLRDTPKKLLATLDIKAENYPKALNILERQYGSQYTDGIDAVIASKHLKPPTPYDVKSLTQYIIECNSILSNCGDDNKKAVFGLFINSLDNVSALEYSKVHKLINPDQDVNLLMDWLNDRVCFLSGARNGNRPLIVDSYIQDNNVDSRDRKYVHFDKKQTNKNAKTYATYNSNFNKSKSKCLICQNQHYTLSCPKLDEAENKQRLLRSKLLCIYCGAHKYSHENPTCLKKQRGIKCEICLSENHVTLLHEKPRATTMTI
jgi:hypothetical protein